MVTAVGSVVEQVAAVLDALSDAKEATRLRVIGLVERLAVRLDRVEAENHKLREDNKQLQQQLQRVSYWQNSSRNCAHITICCLNYLRVLAMGCLNK